MNLSKRQQKLAAIAGLGCLCVLIDQVLLAPSSAVADSPTPARAGPTALTVADEPTVPTVDATLVKTQLAARFQEIASTRGLDPTQVPDAFEVPREWLPDDGELPPPVALNDPGVAKLISKFEKAHRLNAVMANGGAGYAIVDGKRLRMGQKIDGFKLVEFRRRSIVLEGHGTRVELKLPARLGPGRND